MTDVEKRITALEKRMVALESQKQAQPIEIKKDQDELVKAVIEAINQQTSKAGKQRLFI